MAALILLLACLAVRAAGSDLMTEALEAHQCDPRAAGAAAEAARRLPAVELAAALRGRGFHRTLEYTLDLAYSSDVGSGSQQEAAAQQRCEAALLQPLPAAAFASIYELENAAAVGQGPPARLFGPVDVESIESCSRPTLLAVYANVTLAEQVRAGQGFAPAWGAGRRSQLVVMGAKGLAAVP